MKGADRAVLDKYVESDHVYDGQIYRGMHFSREDFDAFMENVQPGSVVHMKRNSSWSSSKEDAYRFGHHADAGASSVIITCVKNRTSAPVDHLSTYGENEVLAHSRAGWTVLHSEIVERRSGERKAYLTVIETGDYR